MKYYEKPMILLNEELAEGVYAASGALSETTVSASITSSNGTNKVWFKGSIKNNTNETITGWTATLTFDGPVRAATVSNCNVTISGNSITISNGYDWNAVIEANSKRDFDGEVTGDNPLSLL